MYILHLQEYDARISKTQQDVIDWRKQRKQRKMPRPGNENETLLDAGKATSAASGACSCSRSCVH
jgi:hypothetical protein